METRAYQVTVTDRREPALEVSLEGEGDLFLDLYESVDGDEEVIFSTSRGEAQFRPRRNRPYIVLLQPKIYAEGVVRLKIQPLER